MTSGRVRPTLRSTRTQAEHLLPGARPQRDGVGTTDRLQGPERVVGVQFGELSHALPLSKSCPPLVQIQVQGVRGWNQLEKRGVPPRWGLR